MTIMKTLKKHKYPYLFILPFFLLFLVFQLIPTLWTIGISFTKWKGIGKPKFVGLQNYKQLFNDYMFWDAIKNTTIYWVTGVVFILLLSIVIATFLNYNHLRGRSFFKSVTFLPNVCAAIAMGIIFGMLFDENVGLINEFISLFGINAVPWLTSTSMSKVPVVVLNIWRNTPWFTIIVLSGLLNIPREYYEAATVDGANAFQQFFRITLPSLYNILFFCFITLTVDSWKIFNEPYILKGPGTSNMSLFQYMYDSGFNIFKMGYASAIGCMLTLILLIVSLIQFRIMRKQGNL
ncbi:sugar ABC transporter permease [Clostridium sediminicola]|uniref:carbohydrate ABC transporter permease n=1 Tax=Clostridium sediminicola TaxID=3114879 RepID=UPI0031F2132C